MTKAQVKVGKLITYNNQKYTIVEVHDLFVVISAVGSQIAFKIGNTHLEYFK